MKADTTRSTAESASAASKSRARNSKIASGAVCVRPSSEPANISVAPNSPSALPHASAAPDASPARAPGIADPRERPRLAGPERPRCVEKVPVERLEGGDRTAHVERRGDEGQRDDDAGRLEDELDAGVVDRPAGEPVRAERGEQRDAGRGGRQDERQLDQRDHHGAAAEVAARDQPGRRGADREDDHERRQRGPQAQPERFGGAALAEAGDEIAGTGLGEQRDQRQGQETEQQRQRRGGEDSKAGRAGHRQPGGGPKPESSRICCPSPETTPSTNCRASSGWAASVVTAIP